MTVTENAISEKTFQPVACLLCGESETRRIASKGQFGWPTYVAICTRCGLVFLNPRWTKAGYDRFYASEYDRYYRFDPEQAQARELKKTAAVWERLQQHGGQDYHPERALDIGCGMGWSLHYLSQQVPGIEISGIEPSETCIKHFVNQIGGRLVARDVDSDWIAGNEARYDLVIFRQVLEHLMDPVETLKVVREALAPGGLLYIAVPDMLHPDGSLSGFWFRSVHTYYFSKITLTRVAARAGLALVAIQEDQSDLWAIFTPGENVPEPQISVYAEQMRSLRQYQRRRTLRALLLLFSPRRVSRLLPASAKNLLPEPLKDRFRRLVYRH